MRRRDTHRGGIKPKRRWRRDSWVGFKPYGAGETKPNHYKEIVKTVWENRRNLRYAWRILRRGVCDGCALGVAGFHDWTISGVHLCTTRSNLLKVNTMGSLDPSVLADVEPLRALRGKELRDLGRLPYPMVRRKGEPGFRRVTWDDALDVVADRLRAAGPDRLGMYLTARGLTNETYYVAQKLVRFLGSNNIDNAARVCHAPSTLVLKETIGAGATTVSYGDVIGTDLVVLIGSNVANAQPVFMKYLYLARQRGAKVAVVNPLREPGLDRYWVPSNVESALFGTKMADEFFGVHVGGDVAFFNGVLKELLAQQAVDREFVSAHTTGFDELVAALDRQPFDELERASGASRGDMARFARMYASAGSAVLVWSMGITQHEHGVDNVAAIVNLALARGNVGRPDAGLMPIRGHSGVQGGAEMGAYATALPGGLPVTPENAAAIADAYGFPVRGEPGLSAAEMVEAAGRRRARRSLLQRRQLPRGASRPARGRGRAGDGAAARPPGHRDVEPDAGRPGRHRRAAAGGDALRAARRRHADKHGAAHRVQPRDPRFAGWGGAERVGDLRRPGAPHRSVTRALDGLRVRRGHP